MRCGRVSAQFRGCPRNCKRIALRQFSHWELGSWEGDDRAAIREPGDLPSTVVTREHVGRGVLMVAEPKAPIGA
jgi:hypothetical protein